MSSHRSIRRPTAMAAIITTIAIMLSGCHTWWFGSDENPSQVAATTTAPTPFCPIPNPTAPPITAPILPANSPDRVERMDPNTGDIAWSCAGKLFVWKMGSAAVTEHNGTFLPYPGPAAWCRTSRPSQPDNVDYRLQSAKETCATGPLQFVVGPDSNNLSPWFDPELRIWLAAFGDDLTTLVGNTYCPTDAWQPINLGETSGGAFFSSDKQACLATYNNANQIGPPPSLELVRQRVQLWTGPEGWYKLSHTPLCEDVYQAHDCAKMY